MNTERALQVIRLEGYSDYQEVWTLQEQILRDVAAGADDVLVLTEHQSTITIGRAGGEDHLLTAEPHLAEQGISVVRTNRGGDITWHGPGQLVCYPIFNLKRHYQDVHRFLRDLEEVGIRILDHYSVKGWRVPGRTGIWTDLGKIAALGIHVKKWTTMHGMAFNVQSRINGFQHIVPCGISDAGVTSLEALINKEISIDDIAELMITKFIEVFGFKTMR